MSGNPGGRPKTKLFRKYLMRSVLKRENGVRVIERITDAMAQQGAKGNINAAEAVRDTLDGKPAPDTSESSGPCINVNVMTMELASVGVESSDQDT